MTTTTTTKTTTTTTGRSMVAKPGYGKNFMLCYNIWKKKVSKRSETGKIKSENKYSI